MIGINKHIFACGGYNGDDELNIVQKYSIEKDEWSFVSPMKYKRQGVVIVALGKYLYALGGFNTDNFGIENQVIEVMYKSGIIEFFLN